MNSLYNPNISKPIPTLYPETYECVYQLVKQGISEYTCSVHDRKSILIDLLKEIDPDLILDEMTKVQREEFFSWMSFSLNHPSEDSQSRFSDHMSEFLYELIKTIIGRIFEKAEECIEVNRISDFEDLRISDNRLRYEDLNQENIRYTFL